VQHIIPAERLSTTYFRRWFYWRGISRALLYERSGLDMEAPERTTLDFSQVPHVLGVPRYLYRKAITAAIDWLRASLRRDPVAAFDHEVWLWFFAGILRQRLRDRPLFRLPASAEASRRRKHREGGKAEATSH
jgi:hypothetical protein